jgi:hypothetical protein
VRAKENAAPNRWRKPEPGAAKKAAAMIAKTLQNGAIDAVRSISNKNSNAGAAEHDRTTAVR